MAKPSKPCLQFNQTEGPVLVVGSKIYEGRQDWRERHPDGVGLDMLAGDGVDIVHDLENATPAAFVGAFAHIECISILEHTKRPWIVAEHLTEMLKTGGSIYLSVPFIWPYHGYPQDFWRITHEALPVLFPRIDWQIVKYKSLDRVFDEPPKKYIEEKGRTLRQCEIVGFGVKCL